MVPIKEQFSDYFFENLAVNSAPNQLQITSICNANCIFCSNNQNPFKIERLPFRPLEEIKRLFWFNKYYDSKEIILNESLPGRISEGEALLHPQIIDILTFIRRMNPYAVIKLCTNGSMLTDDMISALKQFQPMQFTISCHSINKDNWCSIFRLKEEDYHTSISSFQKLKDNGFSVFPAMVALPNFVGYEDMEESIKFFSTISPNLLLWSPGYTKYTNEDAMKYMTYDPDQLQDFVDIMVKKYNMRIYWSLSKHKKLEGRFENEVIEFIKQNHLKGTKGTILVSTSAYPQLMSLLHEESKACPINVNVVCVKNETYGGNIQVSGLWMIKDIQQAIDTNYIENQVLLPGNFLDYFGFDLMGDNIVDFFERNSDKTFNVIRR